MSAGAILFGSAAAVFLYVVAGYPLLLGWMARYRARPVRRQPMLPAISVIIAVHNGERFLADKLRSVLALHYPPERMEVIVASDGSTDGTCRIAEEFAAAGVRLLRLPRGGKPAALNAAMAQASGEILVLTDVRQSLEAESVSLLMESFADPAVGTVSGELIVCQGETHEEASIGLYRRFDNWVRDRLSTIDSMFGATGSFYAIRSRLAVPIPEDILLDDMYLPIAVFFRGYRLVMDTRARAYDYPTSLDTEFKRKVRTLAGNYQLLAAYPQLLGPRNRMWGHFVSYKFGRLLLPWCLMAMALSSFWLPEPLRVLSLSAQAAVYAIAALDPLVRPGSPFKRISVPVRAFVVMMIAILRALSVFFVPARSLWKATSAGNAE